MKTDKHKLQAALVRSFFDAFSSGVIDCGQGSVQERRQPQNVKRAMLDYYEQIAPAFFETIFFPWRSSIPATRRWSAWCARRISSAWI